MGRPSNPFLKEHRDDIANRSANPVFSGGGGVPLPPPFSPDGGRCGAAVSFRF